MKQSEIEQGKRYTDGRGRVREVLHVWRGDKLVRYRVVKGSVEGVKAAHTVLLATFARWAREEVVS